MISELAGAIVVEIEELAVIDKLLLLDAGLARGFSVEVHLVGDQAPLAPVLAQLLVVSEVMNGSLLSDGLESVLTLGLLIVLLRRNLHVLFHLKEVAKIIIPCILPNIGLTRSSLPLDRVLNRVLGVLTLLLLLLLQPLPGILDLGFDLADALGFLLLIILPLLLQHLGSLFAILDVLLRIAHPWLVRSRKLQVVPWIVAFSLPR